MISKFTCLATLQGVMWVTKREELNVDQIPLPNFCFFQVSSQENKTSSCNQLQSCHTFTMFPLSRNVLSSLKIRSIQQIRARQSHAKHSPDFHDKYGNTLLTRGTIFCVVAWVFTITQIGIEWNQSPVGRVTPKEWNDE